MASFCSLGRAGVVIVAAGVMTMISAMPVRAAPQLAVIGLPAAEWQRFAERHPGAVGLGVFPDSRDPKRFVEEIANARGGDHDARTPSTGTRETLGRTLARARIATSFVEAGPSSITEPLVRIFGAAFGRDPSLLVASVQTAEQAEEVMRTAGGNGILLGVGIRTPVWIEICTAGYRCGTSGLLDGGIARRPGIVTPYDVAATLLDIIGEPHPAETYVGKALRTVADPHQLDRVHEIASSLDRDAKVGSGAGGVTVPLSIAASFAGLLLLRTGRRQLAIRAALAAWAANPGYIVALFVPTGSGALRALVVAAVMVAAAAFPTSGSHRAAARLALGITVAFAIVAALAPLRPGALPGTAIWGNPLVSWRFFGLQNFEAGLIASGVVLWGVLAGLSARALAVAALLAGVVIGAPTIGANFVGVLTFAFGVGLAVLALARRRVEAWHLLVSGAIAVVAFVGTLLADAGSPVSHGGRAARRISEGGASTAWEFVRARMRLNLDLIQGFFAGWPLLAAMIVVIGFLLVWGSRDLPPKPGRAAVWACAAMALASMVLEDSGFFSGAIIFVIAMAGYIVAMSQPDDRLTGRT